MTQQHTSVPSAPKALHICAWIAVGSVIVQAVLACFMLSGVRGLGDVHMAFGIVTVLATIIAAILAVMWKRRGGPSAVVGHAAGMAVILLVQFALGELSDGGAIKWIHVVLGVIIMVGLFVLPKSISKASSK
ncbi:hypothetical protein FYJ43_00475 [Cutibacterium sp. WCA-380-WT-3A]|uniref:Uncharacterized protein n=1 Tax=Cutibacterium porci TaxID=2605781 RepID=A0A7K0J3S0_9ACTN|nr:hypothetical protein [Cutibacterium porci]MSS44564.1 hypothetical protein [Cutibacterium porci]